MDFLSENQPNNHDEGLALFDKPVCSENFQSQSDVIIQSLKISRSALMVSQSAIMVEGITTNHTSIKSLVYPKPPRAHLYYRIIGLKIC